MYFSIWLLLTNMRQPGSVVAFLCGEVFQAFQVFSIFGTSISHRLLAVANCRDNQTPQSAT